MNKKSVFFIIFATISFVGLSHASERESAFGFSSAPAKNPFRFAMPTTPPRESSGPKSPARKSLITNSPETPTEDPVAGLAAELDDVLEGQSQFEKCASALGISSSLARQIKKGENLDLARDKLALHTIRRGGVHKLPKLEDLDRRSRVLREIEYAQRRKDLPINVDTE